MHTEPEVREELPAETKGPNSPLLSHLLDTLEMFAWAFLLVVILFTVFFRFCRVEGSSMMNTLAEGETVLVSDIAYTPKTGDVVVFQYKGENLSEPFLIKRVIATGGQRLKIDFSTGEVWIDGQPYADPHAHLMNKSGVNIGRYQTTADCEFYDPYSHVLELTVPEGKLFVMGDNRNYSLDSRDSRVGLVEEELVIGKVILRLFPFSLFL